MEELKIKRNVVLQALATYKEAIEIMENPKYDEIYKTTRDSAIQRFEYTIDAFWKFLKLYMQEQLSLSIEVNNPRAILREALNVQVITYEEFEQLIEGVADRNLTSHSYKEEVAKMLAFHLPIYYEMMHDIVSRMNI